MSYFHLIFLKWPLVLVETFAEGQHVENNKLQTETLTWL